MSSKKQTNNRSYIEIKVHVYRTKKRFNSAVIVDFLTKLIFYINVRMFSKCVGFFLQRNKYWN